MEDTEKKPKAPPADLLGTALPETNGEIEEIKGWYRWGVKTWLVVKGIGVLTGIFTGLLGALYTLAQLVRMLSE